MYPRGMTLLMQAIANGKIQPSQHVEVWLDLDMEPDTGHLRYSGVAYSAEIVVDRHQPIDALDFAAVNGLEVMIVAQTEGNRLALLADRIAQFDPHRLIAVILDDEDNDPIRHFILDGNHV